MNNTKKYGKDFTLVVVGQIVSLFGNAILRFSLPLYLLRETGSSTLFGIVTACSFLPMIVLSLLGGVLADRVNKRNIMVCLDFLTAGVITAFSWLLGIAPMIPLFITVLMLLYGISGTYQPAVQASIPALVPKEKILSANAIVNQIGALANFIGPIIGGMLYGAFGIAIILKVSIMCFALSAVMEIFIKIPFQKQPTQNKALQIVAGDLQESYLGNPWYLFILFMPMMIWGGGLEEIGWRGVFQPLLEKRFSFLVAALIEGVIWGVWHLPLWFVPNSTQGDMNFIAFTLYCITLGLTLGAAYRLTKCIWVTILIHAWGNTVLGGMYTLTSLNNSPSTKTIIVYGLQIAIIMLILVFERKHEKTLEINSIHKR